MAAGKVEAKRAAQALSQGAKAARNVNLATGYGGYPLRSSADLLEQAAEVLLLLQHPMNDPEQQGLTLLFRHRLRRAYGRAQGQ